MHQRATYGLHPLWIILEWTLDSVMFFNSIPSDLVQLEVANPTKG